MLMVRRRSRSSAVVRRRCHAVGHSPAHLGTVNGAFDVVHTAEPRSTSCLPWAGSALLGAAIGCVAWSLTVWARAYCDAGYDAGGRFELNFLLPLRSMLNPAYGQHAFQLCGGGVLGRVQGRSHGFIGGWLAWRAGPTVRSERP